MHSENDKLSEENKKSVRIKRKAQNRICLKGRGGERGWGQGQGQEGEMTQTMYAHVNK
jgi:hypothetical protein